MTDFKRGLKQVNDHKWRAGPWQFIQRTDGDIAVWCHGYKLGVADDLKKAVGWAKLNWRKEEPRLEAQARELDI